MMIMMMAGWTHSSIVKAIVSILSSGVTCVGHPMMCKKSKMDLLIEHLRVLGSLSESNEWTSRMFVNLNVNVHEG